MPFSDLVGNTGVLARIQRFVATDRVPPSLLFSGVQGVGKLEAAVMLAQALNCTALSDDACGQCPSCVRIEKGEHPDVQQASPEGAGGQIKAEPIRELVRDSHARPFEGRKRVYVVDRAEKMNPTAANTLLKTLEEPPAWTVLILVSSNEAALLPTLRSRCQNLRFAPIAVDDVARILETDHGMGKEESLSVAALSGGSLRRALALEPELVRSLRTEALTVVNWVADPASAAEAVPFADRLAKHTELNLFVELLTGLLRDLASLSAGGDIIHRDLGARLEPVSARAPLGDWIRAYNASEQALKDLKLRYANKRITIGVLLTRLGHPA